MGLIPVFEFETKAGFVRGSKNQDKGFILEFCLFGKRYKLEKVNSIQKLEEKYWKVLKENFF